jgi:hypothetical protein
MADWKKLVVSGSNISQLNNDANYLTAASTKAFASASHNGTLILADSSQGNLTFASGSGEGLYITASADNDTLTFGLSAIPNSSLANTGSIIGSTLVDLGATVTTIDGLTLTDVNASGSFSGSFQGDGSGLLGVIADPFPYTGSAIISGSLQVTGSINGLVLGRGAGTYPNIFIGDNALPVVTSGLFNIALSDYALNENTTGNYNIALGNASLRRNTSGYSNISLGKSSMETNTTGFDNISLGYESLYENISGKQNVALGYKAGFNNNGSGNVFIGAEAGPSSYSSPIGQLYIASGSGTPLIGGNFAAKTVTISGSLEVKNSISSPRFSGSFSGSFQGDGSGLTGLVSTLYVSGSTGVGSVDLKTETLTIQGTSNEVETSMSGQTLTIGLPNDVTIGNSLTVTGDLYVNGTTTQINTTEILVEDKFILLASGSVSGSDAGIIIDRGAHAKGNVAYGFDSLTGRWGYQNGIVDTDNVIVIGTNGDSAFAGHVFTEAAHTSAPTTGEFVTAGSIYTATSGDIYIYS